MSKVIGLKLTEKDKELTRQIEDTGLSNSELLRKALIFYFKTVNQSVNQNQQEKNKQKINQVNQTVNHDYKEKHTETVNQVNPQVQIINNYELIEYLRRDHEWLHDRIEHFEHTQDLILSKLDIQHGKDKSKTSWVRM